MCAMSRRGSGTEIASTKSHSPLLATASIASLVISRKRSSSLPTMRGVKPLLMSPRSWACLGSPSSIKPSFTGLPSQDPLGGGEELLVLRAIGDVRVLRDHPDLVLLGPVHRIVLAEPSEALAHVLLHPGL